MTLYDIIWHYMTLYDIIWHYMIWYSSIKDFDSLPSGRLTCDNGKYVGCRWFAFLNTRTFQPAHLDYLQKIHYLPRFCSTSQKSTLALEHIRTLPIHIPSEMRIVFPQHTIPIPAELTADLGFLSIKGEQFKLRPSYPPGCRICLVKSCEIHGFGWLTWPNICMWKFKAGRLDQRFWPCIYISVGCTTECGVSSFWVSSFWGKLGAPESSGYGH